MGELALTSPKETAKAAQAFADYVAMGAERSLEKLYERYRNQPKTGPTRQLSQLKQWSADHNWQERLKALAAEQIAEAAGLRTDTYVAITREYHRRFTDPAMVKVAKLDSLNSVYDRVKPSEADQDAAAPPVLIQIIGVNVEVI